MVPLYRSLVVSGAPATAAFTFLIATPELGLDALLITLPLLGADMMVARLIAAVGVAVVVGLVVGRLVNRSQVPIEVAPEESGEPEAPLSVRIRDGLRYGLSDLVDDTLPWILAQVTSISKLLPCWSDREAYPTLSLHQGNNSDVEVT